MLGRRFGARWIGAVTALTLGVAGSLGTASPVQAALVPRTYTTVMAPTTAIPGVATSYSVVVTNTSTRISALDHFVLSVPSGFTVTVGTVTAPRGGWTESLDSTGTTLTAATSQGVRYGLRKGESLTMTFTATDGTPCDTRTVTWLQKADGVIIDPWVAASPDPAVQMTPVADHFTITSVTDRSTPPLNRAVVKGQPFDVGVQFFCRGVSAPAPGGTTLTLVKVSPGTPDSSGKLGDTVTAAVPSGATSASILGATYSAVESGVGLQVDAVGLPNVDFSLDVLGQADTVSASPGTSTTLSIDSAQASLPNGANGTVALVVSACATTDPYCTSGQQIDLNGSFKDANGTNLYGFGTNAAPGVTASPTDTLAPAQVTRVCSISDCPHRDATEEPSTRYNYSSVKEEQWEDFSDFATYVSLRRSDGTYTPFAPAPACVPQSNPSTTGEMLTYDAQHAGFCVDVNAITRVDSATGSASFNGDLQIPVLFVEDPRLRP
jgi:hypothetical protein